MLPAGIHTISIFARLTRDLPPLVPDKIQRDLSGAMETLSEAELVAAGKSLWPYRRAFQELIAWCEEKIGEIFFASRLTNSLKERYLAFSEHGGDWRAVWSGRPAGFFAPDERALLAAMLIETRQHIRAHAAQAALSVQRQQYEASIEALRLELATYENELQLLRSLADEEAADPALVSEIHAHIHACDHGFCGLEPEVSRHARIRAREHFQGRKEDRRMIPKPLPSFNGNHVL